MELKKKKNPLHWDSVWVIEATGTELLEQAEQAGTSGLAHTIMKPYNEKSRVRAAASVSQMGTTLVSLPPHPLCHPDGFEVPSSYQLLLSLLSLSLGLQNASCFPHQSALKNLVSQALTSLISVSTPILRVTETG